MALCKVVVLALIGAVILQWHSAKLDSSSTEHCDPRISQILQENQLLKDQLAHLQKKVDGIEGKVNNQVGFTAFRHEQTWFESGDKVVFTSAHINAGNGFDLTTGSFFCPVDGMYFFSVTVTCTDEDYLRMTLKTGATVLSGIYCDKDDQDTGTNTLVTMCSAGQELYVESITRGRWVGGNENSFTGFLISL